MGNYSKFFGSIIGGAVGLGFSYLASKGIATCTGVGEAEVCTVLGLSQTAVTATLTMAFSSLFTWAFPANAVA